MIGSTSQNQCFCHSQAETLEVECSSTDCPQLDCPPEEQEQPDLLACCKVPTTVCPLFLTDRALIYRNAPPVPGVQAAFRPAGPSGPLPAAPARPGEGAHER